MARQKLDKTNAVRFLDAQRVPYEALSYDAEIHSAVGVAEVLGVPADRVYKTLVVVSEERGARPHLVMIAGPDELDLRLLARSLEAKAVRMAPQRDAERLTGLQVGGIGALALIGIVQRDFSVLLASVLTIATVVLTANLLVDLIAAWLDPRRVRRASEA